LFVKFDGTVATRRAKPKAPGNEFESRTTKVPGGWCRNIWIAKTKQKK